MSLSMRVDIEGGRLRVTGGFENLAAMISACLEGAIELDKASKSGGTFYCRVVDIAGDSLPDEGSSIQIFDFRERK